MIENKLTDLFNYARSHSPFYRQLYSSLPQTISSIRDLPIIDQGRFWKANTFQNNQILTEPIQGGILFKSGGTTGTPNFSVFSKKEWELFTQAFGNGIASGFLKNGDRIANLFYAGELYGSFLFISQSIERAPIEVLQLPISGSTNLADTLKIVQSLEANVLAGVPTTLLSLADWVETSQSSLKIDRILFGGEPLQPDQRERLRAIFPGVTIHSIGYASTDAGLLGYADRSCGPNEHRTYSEDTILELVDEATGQVIEKENLEGKVVVTNLTRFLMPVIRYPVGDRAMWLEPSGTHDRKFILQGRSDEAARIGPVMLYLEEVKKILDEFQPHLGLGNFQVKVIHREMKDGLILKVAAAALRKDLPAYTEAILKELYRLKPLYLDLLKKDQLLPIELEWVEKSQLEINSRTGKLRRVIDQRFLS